MTTNVKDAAAGAIFVAIGGFFLVYALATLRMGTAFRMGPGYFPIIIGGLLVLFGLAIFIKGIGHVSSPFGTVSWRGIILLTISPIVFAATISGLGLIPAVVLTVLTSAFASRRMGLVTAMLLSIGLTVFCALVFRVGLGLPLRLFGPWLGM